MQKEAIEQKSTSEAVMRRLEKNLETQLDNERLQCRRANTTIKELQEELERTHASSSSLQRIDHPKQESLVDSSKFGLDPLIIALQEENMRQRSIIAKFERVTNKRVPFPPEFASSFEEERERRLKAEEIAAALARRAKSSMDRKNFEIADLKIKFAAFKARKKSSTHEISSQKDKQTNAGKSVALDGTLSHMSDQEELEFLRPTVENLKELFEIKDQALNEIQVRHTLLWHPHVYIVLVRD